MHGQCEAWENAASPPAVPLWLKHGVCWESVAHKKVDALQEPQPNHQSLFADETQRRLGTGKNASS